MISFYFQLYKGPEQNSSVILTTLCSVVWLFQFCYINYRLILLKLQCY